MGKRGFTLVEIIISIVLIGIFLAAGTTIFSASSTKGVNIEAMTVAESLAEGQLEELNAKSFDQISSEAQTNYTGDLNQYSRETIVDYVNSSDLSVPVAGPTDYKKIQVKIRHSLITGSIDLETLRANY